jgi:anti-anti-sigma factor
MSIEELSDSLIFSGDEPLLSLHLVGRGPVVLIEVGGEMDVSSVHLLTELVQHVTRDRPARLVLDMAKVSFFCTDGLRALLHARDTITAAGGQLVLRAPSPQTRRMLAITQTDHLFPVDTDTTIDAS